MDTLASSCTASLSASLEECDLDTVVPSLEAQNSQLSGDSSVDNWALSYAVWAMHSACLEDPTAASLGLIPRETLAAAFDVSPATIAAELDPFRDGLGFVAPGFEACEQYKKSISAFAEAASLQGRFPGTVEVHHRWHEKTAEALFYLGEMLALLPDQCSSDDECPQDSACVCNDSEESPRRRRALLFATIPPSSRSTCKCQ